MGKQKKLTVNLYYYSIAGSCIHKSEQSFGFPIYKVFLDIFAC